MKIVLKDNLLGINILKNITNKKTRQYQPIEFVPLFKKTGLAFLLEYAITYVKPIESEDLQNTSCDIRNCLQRKLLSKN